jgi:hypothetical protein
VGLRRARPAGPAAGLGRCTPNEPERLQSNRPGSRDPSRLGRVCCSQSRRHLAPCRLPRAWATSSKDGWSLQAIPSPAPCRGLPRSSTMDPRKMRLFDFCNRLQTRAPHRLTDSRVRPSPCLRPSREETRRRTRTHPRPMASGEPPGEASLDGEPPASALSQPVTARVRSGYPDCCIGRGRDAARSWWSFDRMLLTRCTSRPRRFQPRAEPAT